MGRLVTILALAGLLGSVGVSGAAATAMPNPCQILPSTAITAVLGSSTVGKLSTQGTGSFKETVCTFTKGSGKLELSVGAAIIADGGFGGPATVSRADSAYGPHGHLSYDISAPYIYATVSFVKGPYYASVWSNTVAAAGVEQLATAFYKKI